MKKLLVSMILCLIFVSTISFSCAERDIHESVTLLIKNSGGAVKIRNGKLFVNTKVLAEVAMQMNNYDEEDAKDQLESVIFALALYAGYHDLKLVSAD